MTQVGCHVTHSHIILTTSSKNFTPHRLSMLFIYTVPSPFLHHPILDAPVCTVDKTIIVGAFRSEHLNVICEVNADPPPRSFKWKFNSSGETYELSKERHYKNGSKSVLQYTPVMDQDYGTLTCSGQNEVGEQVAPCVFQVILAGECSHEIKQAN